MLSMSDLSFPTIQGFLPEGGIHLIQLWSFPRMTQECTTLCLDDALQAKQEAFDLGSISKIFIVQ